MLTSDNPTLNNAAEDFVNAIKNVDKAAELDLSEERICELEEIEEEKQQAFLAVIHAMLPSHILKSIKCLRKYNASVIDKYIIPLV